MVSTWRACREPVKGMATQAKPMHSNGIPRAASRTASAGTRGMGRRISNGNLKSLGSLGRHACGGVGHASSDVPCRKQLEPGEHSGNAHLSRAVHIARHACCKGEAIPQNVWHAAAMVQQRYRRALETSAELGAESLQSFSMSWLQLLIRLQKKHLLKSLR